jgi:hypothetical protein
METQDLNNSFAIWYVKPDGGIYRYEPAGSTHLGAILGEAIATLPGRSP